MYKVTLFCFIIVFALTCAQSTIGQVQFVLIANPNKQPDTFGANPTPGFRYGSCLQVTSDNSSLYMFAGHTDNGLSTAYLWTYSLCNPPCNTTGFWNTLSPPRSNTPSARSLMSCWVDNQDALNIYGGDSSQNDYVQPSLLSDQWVYNSSWKQVTVAANPGVLAQAATFRVSPFTYIFGGFTGNRGFALYTNALWVWSDSARNWTLLNSDSGTNVGVNYKLANGPLNPGSRSKVGATTDLVNNRLWIFGGNGPSVVYGDLWYYTISTGLWTYVSGKTSKNNNTISDGMPACTYGSVMAMTTLGNIIIYGGTVQTTTSTFGVTYFWKYSVSSNTWILFDPSSYNVNPPLSQFSSYVADGSGGAYLFGGQLNTTATSSDALIHLIFNECPTGSFINSSGLCSLCPPGTAQNGTDVCAKCAVGSANAVYGFNGTSCNACPIGTYASTTGKTACTPCPSGTSTAKVGSTACGKSCPAGTFGLLGNCSQCSPGYYAPSSKALSCKACAPGTYQPNYGGTSCFTCNTAGTFSDGAATSCYSCPVGTFYPFVKGGFNSPAGCRPCPPGTSTNNAVGAGKCTSCPVGTYTDTYGSATCTACPFGTMAPNNGTAVCTPCAPGTHAATTGTAQCTQCPINRVARNYGTRFCDYCLYGTIPSQNYTVCSYCPVGTYHDANNVASSCPIDPVTKNRTSCCSPCPKNTYADTQGSIICKACPVGFIATSTGSTYCTQCPMNTRRYNTSSCLACDQGTYSPGGSAYCSSTGYF